MNIPYDYESEYKENILVILLIVFCCIGSFSRKRKNSHNRKSETNSREDWDQFGLVRKLSIEQLRFYDGFKDVTEKQANEIIESLYQLSILTFNVYKKEHCFLIIENESNVK